MKALNSDKTFAPLFIPLPIVTAANGMQSGGVSNSVPNVAMTPYKDLGLISATRLCREASVYNDVSPRVKPQYSLKKDNPMISSHSTETKVQNDTLVYKDKSYSSKLSSETLNVESGSSPSTFEPSSEGVANHTNNLGLISFMKSLLGDKALESISLLSISFFVSGSLLMFYLINLL